jgi:hypothetical protein
MFKIKTLVAAAFFSIPTIHYSQHTDQINSNRPGETMSAFAVGKSVIQLESGLYGIREKHSIENWDANGYGLDLTIRWGLFLERLELIADLQCQSEIRNYNLKSEDWTAMKQTVFGAKYLIYDPFKNYEEKINVYSWKANHSFKWHQLIPAVSAFVGANVTFSNNPYAFSSKASLTPKIVLITQNHFGDGKWVFVTNIIADYISSDFPSYGYGITLTRGFNNKWSGFVENQGYKSDFYSDAIVRSGAAYLLTNDIQIDASISSSLKNTPSILYGGLGFSWRYDSNYKEVRMSIDSGGSDKKAKKRAKKTKKG